MNIVLLTWDAPLNPWAVMWMLADYERRKGVYGDGPAATWYMTWRPAAGLKVATIGGPDG